MRKDYYYILGIKRDASIQEIKEAFRKLSLKFHPDMNKETDNTFWSDRFVEIKEAYDILSDENKRIDYDKNNEAETKKTNFKNEKNSNNEILFLNDLDKEIEAYLQKKRIAKQYANELSNIYPAKKKMTTEKWTVSVLLLLFFSFLASKSNIGLNMFDFASKTHEISVDTEKIAIYSEPDINSEIIGSIQADEKGIEFMTQTNYFYKIRYNNDLFGYVRKSKINYTNTDLPFDEIVKKDDNNVDKIPDKDYSDYKDESESNNISIPANEDTAFYGD